MKNLISSSIAVLIIVGAILFACIGCSDSPTLPQKVPSENPTTVEQEGSIQSVSTTEFTYEFSYDDRDYSVNFERETFDEVSQHAFNIHDTLRYSVYSFYISEFLDLPDHYSLPVTEVYIRPPGVHIKEYHNQVDSTRIEAAIVAVANSIKPTSRFNQLE